MNFSEVKLRSRVPDADIEPMIGKILTDNEYDLLVSGPTSITIPSDAGGSKPLLKYLPGAFSGEEMAEFYGTLHELRKYETTNRGNASGTPRLPRKLAAPDGSTVDSSWTYSKPVPSAIVGAFDAQPKEPYCRLTAWSGRDFDKFASLFPMFEKIGTLFAEQVPDRFKAQMGWVRETEADWVIPGTPFTTVTVNNTYPTGVHTDKGDLDEGFSTLATLRRGTYRGGRLVFPQWRVAVDMQDGDLLLMDAHQWHGNTALELLDPPCYVCSEPKAATVRATFLLANRERERDLCEQHWAQVHLVESSPAIVRSEPITLAERISVVCYYRTRMKECGTQAEEDAKQQIAGDKQIDRHAALVEEMAVEAMGN